ncbi:MAG: hypothetical protein JWP44_5100 [Mucilaginibacter sp.]|nr:hypothetical protein [Mucilaginibacter sp.]
MLMTLRKLLKDVLTENDGQSYCPVRVFAAALSTPTVILFVTGFSRAIYQDHFNGLDLATAFSTMCAGFAALGAGVAVKSFSDNRSRDDATHG